MIWEGPNYPWLASCGFVAFSSCSLSILLHSAIMLSYYNVARMYWRLAIEQTMRQTPNSCGTCGGYTSPHVGLNAWSPCLENCRGWSNKITFARVYVCVCVCVSSWNINNLLHVTCKGWRVGKISTLEMTFFWANHYIYNSWTWIKGIVAGIPLLNHHHSGWPRLRLPNDLSRFLHHFDSTHHTLWLDAAL